MSGLVRPPPSTMTASRTHTSTEGLSHTITQSLQVVNSHPMQTRAKSNISKPRTILSLVASSSEIEPRNFTEANKDPKWRLAIADEFNALLENKTLELVRRTTNMSVVTYKWIYKIKYRSDGSVERPKTRLIARGIHQLAGIDFHETYSLVIKPTTVRLIFSLAVTSGWVIHQLDVKNAFLHGYLNEEVYMCQPPGFEHPQYPNHVCRLHRSIYGLKQAPRAWYHRFSSFLL